MTKELKALYALQEIGEYSVDSPYYVDFHIKDTDEYRIVETALKRLEEHDNVFKKYDISDIWLEPALYVIKNHFPMDIETQLKKLKSLEIIKKKEVDIHSFKEFIIKQNWTYEQYLDEENDLNTTGHQFAYKHLTQEEFNLLKEELYHE